MYTANLKQTIIVAVAIFTLFVNCAFSQTPPPGTLPGNIDVSPTGAASYTIPINAPTGIGGIAPQLAITYSSQAGDGLLGRGWNLAGISAITRLGQSKYFDNNTTAVNFTSTDRFALDGQRLFSDVNYGGDGCVYTKESVDFTEIKSTGGTTGNPDKFTVTTTDGTVLVYDFKVKVPGTGTQPTYMWLLQTMTNRLGNVINYVYTDKGNGQYTLDEINYSGVCKVNFLYEAGITRTGYINGVLFTQNLRLKTITTTNNGVQHQYVFSYFNNTSLFKNKLQYIHYQKVTSGTVDICKPTEITWGTAADYNPATNIEQTIESSAANSTMYFGDFNGDGRTDIVKFVNENTTAYTTDSKSTGYNVVVSMANNDGTYTPLQVPLPDRSCILRTYTPESFFDSQIILPGLPSGRITGTTEETNYDIKNINAVKLSLTTNDQLIIPFSVCHYFINSTDVSGTYSYTEAIQSYKYENGQFVKTDYELLNQIGKDYVIYGNDGKPVTLGITGVEYFEHIKSNFTVAYDDVNNDDNLDRIESHNFAYYDEIENYDYVFKIAKLRLNVGIINLPDRSVNDISLIDNFFFDNIRFVDFNGNGEVEVFLYRDKNFYNIGEFDNVLNDFDHLGISIGATGNVSNMRLGDLNNDGKTDYLWYNNSWEVWYSTGNGFVQGAALGLNNADPSKNGVAYQEILSGYYASTDVAVADINSDGYIDIVQAVRGYVTPYISNGTTFDKKETIETYPDNDAPQGQRI